MQDKTYTIPWDNLMKKNQKSHHIRIQNMSCASCVSKIETALRAVPHVDDVAVNLADRSALINGTPSPDALLEALQQIGYPGTLADPTTQDILEDDVEQRQHQLDLWRKTLVAALTALPLFISNMVYPFIPILQAQHGLLIYFIIGVICLAALIYSAGYIYRGAWQSFKRHSANMDTLIGIGTGAAWLYSMAVVLFLHHLPALAQHVYFESALLIVAFVNLGALLEARARGKSSQAIKRLLGLQAKTARVLRDGDELDIPITDVILDDLIRMRPGEKIPVDGVITEGHSAINESMITGEPVPVSKHVSDEVTAGTLNTSGTFLLKATRIGRDTVLSHIIDMVRQAQNTKPPIGKLVDKVAAYFVPAVLIIAVITALIWFNIGPTPAPIYMMVTAMTVLIIACPCALGLGTPISLMVGMGRAAEYGILIRNGDALQQASKLDILILDKTGTITQGKPSVTHTVTSTEISEDQLLMVAASLEKASEHPLAQAILQYAEKKGVKPVETLHFQNLEGFGVRAKIADQWAILGNGKFMQENRLSLDTLSTRTHDLIAQGQSVVYVAHNDVLLGCLFISDPIKDGAAHAFERFKHLGLKTVVLSGDNKATVQAVTAAVGADDFVADALPHEKLHLIERYQQQGHLVGMVGDGINDAPSLAKADVGFAIGTGTDIAIESADITLMRGELDTIADTIALSKATLRNIKQNLVGAFLYNIIGIPIAAGALFPFTHTLLSSIIAGTAMAFSSVTVVSHAKPPAFF